METLLIDGVVSSSLLPTIMALGAGKMYSQNNSDILYTTAALGVTLSSCFTSLKFHLKSISGSRNQLAIFTSTLLTAGIVACILMFHIIRYNVNPGYHLPNAVQDLVVTNGSDRFYFHFHADLIPSFLLYIQCLFCSLIHNDLMNKAKRKFTYGEASIISQLVSVAFLVWSLTLYSRLTNAGPFQVEKTTEIILNIGVIIASVAFLPGYLFLKRKLPIVRYSLILVSLMICYAVSRKVISTSRINEPFTWLVDYIFSTHQRISLFSLWLSTVVACMSFSTSWARLVGQSNCLVRKVFHLAICIIFISGYNQDIDFTRFAAAGMLMVLILVEMVRAWDLYPFSQPIEEVYRSLRGKWDNRYLTVSHMYLLVGVMMPLWILPYTSQSKLALSCGLISVGVGDTAAAIIGTFLGKTSLRSGKTVEGLVGNITAMASFKLIWIGFSGFQGEFAFAMAVVLTAFVEVVSRNCDNLILPLILMLTIEIF